MRKHLEIKDTFRNQSPMRGRPDLPPNAACVLQMQPWLLNMKSSMTRKVGANAAADSFQHHGGGQCAG
jgi:hypothetical protein